MKRYTGQKDSELTALSLDKGTTQEAKQQFYIGIAERSTGGSTTVLQHRHN